jgi:homogentisate 1,2-dioxygenase
LCGFFYVVFFVLQVPHFCFMKVSDVLAEMEIKERDGVPIGHAVTFVTLQGELITLDNCQKTGHKMNLNENGMINLKQLNNTAHAVAVDFWGIVEFNKKPVFI